MSPVTAPPYNPPGATINARPVSTHGGCDGRVTTSADGGTPPYVFNWTKKNPQTGVFEPFSHEKDLINLEPGEYKLELVDFAGLKAFMGPVGVLNQEPPQGSGMYYSSRGYTYDLTTDELIVKTMAGRLTPIPVPLQKSAKLFMNGVVSKRVTSSSSLDAELRSWIDSQT